MNFGDRGWSQPAGAGPVRINRKVVGKNVTPSAATVTIDGIPQGFSALALRWNARGDTAAFTSKLQLQFNGDSGASSYDWAAHQQFGTSTGTSTTLNPGASILIGFVAAASATAGCSGMGTIEMPDYAGVDFRKSAFCLSGVSVADSGNNSQVNTCYGQWTASTTSPITSITLSLDAGNFVNGSSFTLYGLP